MVGGGGKAVCRRGQLSAHGLPVGSARLHGCRRSATGRRRLRYALRTKRDLRSVPRGNRVTAAFHARLGTLCLPALLTRADNARNMRQEQQPTAAFLSHTLSRPGKQVAHRQQRANGGFYITAQEKKDGVATGSFERKKPAPVIFKVLCGFMAASMACGQLIGHCVQNGNCFIRVVQKLLHLRQAAAVLEL